jgi:Holliday junction resolvasome RuvABC endonuclease subunit
MRPARAIALLGAAYVIVGCGASAKDQVQAKVEQFAHATASRDYGTLCSQVLAPDLVQHLTDAGLTCHQAMKVFVQSVQNPTLSVSKVSVKGQTASAIVLASATGQKAALESIELIETKHGWRLESLASPQ